MLRAAMVGAAFITAGGLLSFGYRYLDTLVRNRPEPFHTKLIEELTGWWGVGLLLPGLVWFARRLRGRPVPSQVGWHLLALLAFSFIHTSWNWGTRVAGFSVLGLGEYDYGIMGLRYLMEFPNDVILYAILLCGVLLFDHYRAGRDRELRMARLEGELARHRLKALEGQLQPHFLFNTLHTISSVMYEDPGAADRMIAGLSELLRRSLQSGDAHETALGEEIETLRLYADLMGARFGERLDLALDVPDALGGAAVPQLLLQPLVENAVRHGDPGPGRPARIAVRARRDNGRLVITVDDNGPGLTPQPTEGMERGLGIANTRRRLEQLYGDSQELALANRVGGGVRVTVALPFRTLESDAR